MLLLLVLLSRCFAVVIVGPALARTAMGNGHKGWRSFVKISSRGFAMLIVLNGRDEKAGSCGDDPKVCNLEFGIMTIRSALPLCITASDNFRRYLETPMMC